MLKPYQPLSLTSHPSWRLNPHFSLFSLSPTLIFPSLTLSSPTTPTTTTRILSPEICRQHLSPLFTPAMDFASGGRSHNIIIIVSILLILAYCSTFRLANASIHVYDKEVFAEVGNAYLLSGGSEGIVASSSSTGRSYIR